MLTNQPELIYNSSVRDTGCGLEDLRGAMDDRDQWRERERERERERVWEIRTVSVI